LYIQVVREEVMKNKLPVIIIFFVIFILVTPVWTVAFGGRLLEDNINDQLKDGLYNYENIPVEVVENSKIYLPIIFTIDTFEEATEVIAGGGHSCALTGNSGVKCWGRNSWGQLGDGTNNNSNIPVDVVELGTEVVTMTGGGLHTCALTSSGGIKCWGLNYDGQLGDGTYTDSNVPSDVVGLGGGTSVVSAGWNHTCTLIGSGEVKCWGNNEFGQLGNGTNNKSNTPVDVVGLGSEISTLTGGGVHTCVLTSSGGIKCWGENEYGQLGDGTNTDSNTPVEVIGLDSGATAVATGIHHTCALTSNGGVKCWGWNTSGQIGDGTNINRNIPTNVIGLESGIAAVSAGGDHTCALTSSGEVKCWGGNYDGQLGDGTNIRKYIPVDVVGLGDGVVMVTTGHSHTCAMTSSGEVKCWGQNTYGQLGNGTNNHSNIPVDVVSF
jgi:alpha-tubulin suppressor-like RCC1 family protein